MVNMSWTITFWLRIMNTSLILDNILFLSIVCILYYKLQIIYLEYMTYNPQQSNQSITHCSNFGIGHSMPLFGIVNYCANIFNKRIDEWERGKL